LYLHANNLGKKEDKNTDDTLLGHRPAAPTPRAASRCADSQTTPKTCAVKINKHSFRRLKNQLLQIFRGSKVMRAHKVRPKLREVPLQNTTQSVVVL
jgi:hypothetical protein